MKTKRKAPKIFFCILVIFILSCSSVTDLVGTPSAPGADSALQPAEPPTASPPPTVAPTATVWPPVFNPDAVGDNRVLDSFILVSKEQVTGCGGFDEVDRTYTIGYVKEPFSAYNVHKFRIADDEYFEHRKYLIGGRFYQTNATFEWFIFPEAPPNEIQELQDDADMREGLIMSSNLVESAQFVGQEDFAGIPANHFTLDETNLREGSDPTGTYKIDAAQGDLHLSQGGNYLLYFHLKLTGNLCSKGGSPGYFPGEREITEELTSINQLKEIVAPAEYLEPQQTLQDLGLPLPAGSILTYLLGFTGGLGVESYAFAASLSNAEFLEFYRTMAPIDGWSVSHIGIVVFALYPDRLHPDCGSRDCVIITREDDQVILYYGDGGFGADYDTQHLYGPRQ